MKRQSKEKSIGQRLAILIAAGLGAFVIMIVSALLAYTLVGGARTSAALTISDGTNANTNTNAPVQVPNPSGLDSSGGLSAPQAPASGDSSSSSGGYAVSADQAANIALNSVPGASLLQQPTLVNLQGTVAYEVQLDRGVVYVDANSGQVLFNGANRRRRHR